MLGTEPGHMCDVLAVISREAVRPDPHGVQEKSGQRSWWGRPGPVVVHLHSFGSADGKLELREGQAGKLCFIFYVL